MIEYSELLWMSSSPNVRICVIGMLINLKVLAVFMKAGWGFMVLRDKQELYISLHGLLQTTEQI